MNFFVKFKSGRKIVGRELIDTANGWIFYNPNIGKVVQPFNFKKFFHASEAIKEYIIVNEIEKLFIAPD